MIIHVVNGNLYLSIIIVLPLQTVVSLSLQFFCFFCSLSVMPLYPSCSSQECDHDTNTCCYLKSYSNKVVLECYTNELQCIGYKKPPLKWFVFWHSYKSISLRLPLSRVSPFHSVTKNFCVHSYKPLGPRYFWRYPRNLWRTCTGLN